MTGAKDPKTEDDAPAEPPADDRHPLTKAAWDGYRQYREEMDQRGYMGNTKNMKAMDVVLLGVIMFAIFGALSFFHGE